MGLQDPTKRLPLDNVTSLNTRAKNDKAIKGVLGSKLENDADIDEYTERPAFKFNVKGGGITRVVPGTLSKPLADRTTVMAPHVSLSSPSNSDSAPSISALVASVDEHGTWYLGSVRMQIGGQNLVDEPEEIVLERLRLWRKKYKGLSNKDVSVSRPPISPVQLHSAVRVRRHTYWTARQ
ncbi:hypothetical protein LTR81_001117 [Elasticomyces elasticus]